MARTNLKKTQLRFPLNGLNRDALHAKLADHDTVADRNLGPYTTAARPAANSVQIGAHYFDTTLNKPAWSDGTNWRDAAAVVV